jgi:cell division septal protein FtsQ
MRGEKQMSFAYGADFYTPPAKISLKREERKRNNLLRLIKLSLLLLLFIVTGIGIKFLAENLLRWNYLQIRDYSIVNPPRFYGSEVRQVLEKFPKNILALDLKALRQALLEIPEVRQVEISKSLPSAVTIRFELEQPFFQVEQSNGSFEIVNSAGKFIRSSSEGESGLITLRNVKPADLPAILACAGLISEIERDVEYISFRKPFGVIVKLADIDEQIIIGKDEFAKKIELYLRIKNELRGLPGRIIKADLRFGNRFYLEFFPGGENER